VGLSWGSKNPKKRARFTGGGCPGRRTAKFSRPRDWGGPTVETCAWEKGKPRTEEIRNSMVYERGRKLGTKQQKINTSG